MEQNRLGCCWKHLLKTSHCPCKLGIFFYIFFFSKASFNIFFLQSLWYLCNFSIRDQRGLSPFYPVSPRQRWLYAHALRTFPVQVLTLVSMKMNSGSFSTLQNKVRTCPIIYVAPLWFVLHVTYLLCVFYIKTPSLSNCLRIVPAIIDARVIYKQDYALVA